jgi:hypothetical protein
VGSKKPSGASSASRNEFGSFHICRKPGGLTRCIAAPDRISFAAMVTYGFGCVAIMIAAAVSGFTVPDRVKHMVRSSGSSSLDLSCSLGRGAVDRCNRALAQIDPLS